MKKSVLLVLFAASIGFATNGCQPSLSPTLPPPELTPSLEEGRPFSEEYPAWRMPELAVTELSIEPERASPGDEVFLLAAVSNIGSGDTGPADLVFAVNGVELDRVPISPLVPYETTMESAIWTADRPGPHGVRVHLELGQGSVDWTSGNNFQVATVRVSGEDDPEPELEFGEIDFNSLQLIPGESYEIPVIVRNPGFAHIPIIPVTLYIDDEPVSEDVIGSLGPGERQELIIPWPEVTPGEHLVTVQMDLPDEFPDAELQNTRSWYVIVPDRTVLHNSGEDEWVSIGPRMLDNGWVGRMNAIAFHPTNADEMYAGGGWEDCWESTCLVSASGLWKTTNGGDSWLPIGDKLDSMLIGAVAVDPEHPEIVYAATGHSVRGPRGAGIFKSTDAGQTWTQFASRAVAGGAARLVIRYARPGEVMIYAGTDRGVLRYKSDDPYALTSGISEWDVIKAGVVRDLVVHPTDHSLVYASIDDDGLYRTEIGEYARVETSPTKHDWTRLTQGLPRTLSTRNHQWLTVDIHRGYPNVLFAGVLNPSSDIYFALYWSPHNGDTWELVQAYAEDELDEGLYNPYVRIHPERSLPYVTVYFGGVRLYKWVGDPQIPGVSGKTLWVEDAAYDIKSLEFYPASVHIHPLQMYDTYLSLGDQGIFRCTLAPAETEYNIPDIEAKNYARSGDDCVHRNQDLRVSQLYDFDVSRCDPNLIIGGTQDTGTILYEGRPDWRMVKGGDGLYSLIDPNNDRVMYAQHQSLAGKEPTRRTADGGKNWSPINTENLPEGYGDKAYIAHDPAASNVLLAVGDQVYYTDDGGQSWTGQGPKHSKFTGSVTRVVVQPDTGNWIAGTDTGQVWIWYRADWQRAVRGHLTWEPLYMHPDRVSVQSMAFLPSDSAILYLSFNGGKWWRRIWRFEMDQTPWGRWSHITITSNFPADLMPRVIAGDPRDPFVAYVGTDKGVWRWELHTDTSRKWQPYNDGLPLTTVVDLLPVPQTGVLLAATKGRGAWSVTTGP